MSERMAKINSRLRREISVAIAREALWDSGLITVSRVKCSSDLRSATVYISVMPENKSGSALKALKKSNSGISRGFKRLNLKNVPKLRWKVDSQERFAAEIEKAVQNMNK